MLHLVSGCNTNFDSDSLSLTVRDVRYFDQSIDIDVLELVNVDFSPAALTNAPRTTYIMTNCIEDSNIETDYVLVLRQADDKVVAKALYKLDAHKKRYVHVSGSEMDILTINKLAVVKL